VASNQYMNQMLAYQKQHI